jgi:hypothetical protein
VRRFIDRKRLRAAALTDGTVGAGVAVPALGRLPSVEGLAGSGPTVDDGLLRHPDLRCGGAEGVVAAGDIVRWPHRLLDDEPIAVGRWSNAVEQGRHAARTLLAVPAAHGPSSRTRPTSPTSHRTPAGSSPSTADAA